MAFIIKISFGRIKALFITFFKDVFKPIQIMYLIQIMIQSALEFQQILMLKQL